MSEILLTEYRHTLPEDLLGLVQAHLDCLERGDWGAVLTDPGSRELLDRLGETSHTSVCYDDYLRALSAFFSVQDKASSKHSHKCHVAFVVGYACLQAFLQANVTGPPLVFQTAGLLLPYAVSKNEEYLKVTQASLLASLNVDGEAPYRLISNIELFCWAKAIFSSSEVLIHVRTARWARLRVSFLHQRLLSEVAPSLQESLYQHLAVIESDISSLAPPDRQKAVFVSFLLERAAIHTHHGFDKKARSDLDQAAKHRRFNFALTGILGKRTKFQDRDISQLVLLAKSSSDNNYEPSLNSHLENSYMENTGSKGLEEVAVKPVTLDLNDDTLFDSISFARTGEDPTRIEDESSLPASLTSLNPSDQPLLAPLDSIILLSIASSITNTSPNHGLTREETLPYATRVLEGGSSNWQIYTQALLIRSRIEGYKTRTTERGLLQLQALVDQVIAETTSGGTKTFSEPVELGVNSFLPKAKSSDAAPVTERLQYIYLLSSPFRWELEAELAQRWVSLGGLRSALEIYERLELWAEAALCWAAVQREDKAKKMVRKQLFGPTNGKDVPVDEDAETWEGPARDPTPVDAPRLYCILGDIDSDPAMYEQAWTVSGNRYARAQRSLGRHWFSKNDYAKSANAYGKSLKANQLHGPSWFAFGCALLQLSQFERAVEAFSRTVQLDDSDAEAWSNLATALLHLEDGTAAAASFNADAVTKSALDDEGALEPNKPPRDPQQHRKDALQALKHAATLKFDSFRIWDNLLTVAVSLKPPAYADVVAAQKRVIELRGSTVGEKSVDEQVLELLVRHVIASEPEGYDSSKPGLARMVVELVDKSIMPLITASPRLWQVVAKLAVWRKRPSSALEANEKAWRTVVTQPGWEYGTEEQWNEVVDATVELADAYESLGPMEKTEGLSGGTGELVAKDWKFKARTAIRGIMGRGKNSWEDTKGWDRLKDAMEGLKG